MIYLALKKNGQYVLKQSGFDWYDNSFYVIYTDDIGSARLFYGQEDLTYFVEDCETYAHESDFEVVTIVMEEE